MKGRMHGVVRWVKSDGALWMALVISMFLVAPLAAAIIDNAWSYWMDEPGAMVWGSVVLLVSGGYVLWVRLNNRATRTLRGALNIIFCANAMASEMDKDFSGLYAESDGWTLEIKRNEQSDT